MTKETAQRYGDFLERAERGEIPKHGMQSSVDVQTALELLELGYLEGTPLRDGQGNILNIGGTRVNVHGRHWLQSLQNPPPPERVAPFSKVKNNPFFVGLLIVAAAIAAIAALMKNLTTIKETFWKWLGVE